MRWAEPRHPGAALWKPLLGLLALCCCCKAAPSPASDGDLSRHWESVSAYLTRYGYVRRDSNAAVADLRREAGLRAAVRSMQRFGGLPPTGRVDAATLSLLQKRRCGLPDVSAQDRVRRYAVQGQRWQKNNLTWSVKYFPSGGGLSPELVRSELSRAFSLWSAASLLSFRELPPRSRADIEVSFERGQHGDGYAFDGRGVVLAHAFFPGEGIGGDAHFDAEEPWVDREPDAGRDGVRLFAVAAHEFGHSLGLSHSSASGALMNPFYQPLSHGFVLPHDDAIGIQAIYGARNPTHWAPLRPYNPGSTRAPHGRDPTHREPSQPGPPGAPGAPERPEVPRGPSKPITCNTTVDAIAVIRRELFVFKGQYFWRVNSRGMSKEYPAELGTFWPDAELLGVDAVYERTLDDRIVFFYGRQYWVFNAHVKERGYPRPLTDLGLPPDLERVEAALVWGHNGKTYLFAGDKYWRLDEQEGRVELDYPRHVDMWRGVPSPIDAVFKHIDGVTHFVQGQNYFRFDDALMRVDPRQKSRDLSHFLFGCPARTAEEPVGGSARTAESRAPPAATSTPHQLVVLLASLLVHLVVGRRIS